MAYPYYNSYMAGYYAPQGAYGGAQAMNAAQQVNNTPAAQNANNGLIWVQGETGAKSYIVAPNTTALLMDSEADRFYLKSVDASGMPLPLRVFEFKEKTSSTKPQNASETHEDMTVDKYITRDEFERRMAEITRRKDEAIGDE